MSGNIGGVDASIPLQAGKGVQQPNPLQQIGQFAQIQNALNQNRLFPTQQSLLQQELQGIQTKVANQRVQSAYNYAAPLLAQPSITHDQFTSALAGMESMGIPTHDIINDVLKNAPSGDGPDFTNYARAAIAARMQVNPEAALGAVTPHAGPVLNNGAVQIPTVVAPAGAPAPGVISPSGGTLPNQLSPSELATPTQIGVTPQGAPVKGTLGQFLQATGGASPLGTGRIPAALQGPNAPQQQAPAGGGVPMGLGPAREAQMQHQGTASDAGFQTISDQGVHARGQNAILGNMLADAGQFTTGPQAYNNFKAWLVRNGAALGTSFGLDPTKVAANESFDKLANQIADAQGAGSDARLAVIQHANPGSQLSPAGVDSIIRQLQGNADYLLARQKLAAAYPDQQNIRSFEADIGSKLDPRAFQFMRMTPQQQHDYVKSLSSQDLKALEASGQWAAQHGLFGAPNG